MLSEQSKGYNKEADKQNAMLAEIIYLKKSNEEKDKINLGLITALNKSKEVQISAKNLNKLKVQKIMIIFENLQKAFNELFKNEPQISELYTIKKLFNNFSDAINEGFRKEYIENKINAPISTENDPIRLLLNKMGSYAKTNQSAEQKKASIKRNTIKLETEANIKPSQIKPISDLKLAKDEKYETLADKFLESDKEMESVYEKLLSANKSDAYPTPNESGFDLKEAINPKDDLAEIMKSFNFDE